MRCPHCCAATPVEIRLTYGGSRFTMHSCSSCETRWWDRNGQPVQLDRVLTTIAAA